jgi:hypothetical protein
MGVRERAAEGHARTGDTGIYPEYYAAERGLPIVREGSGLEFAWNHIGSEE